MNLHELLRISHKAWDREGICQGKAEGEEALFPVPPELSDDVLDVILVDQEVFLHNRFSGAAAFGTEEDLLLIIPGHPGVRDKSGRDQRMCSTAFGAEYALDNDLKKVREVFDMTMVVSVADQETCFPA